MKLEVIALVLAGVGVTHADPALSVHGGGGIPLNKKYSTGSSVLAGGSFRLENAAKRWCPTFSLDARHFVGEEDVEIGDHTTAANPRATSVRALAGIRIESRTSVVQWFGQMSIGLEWVHTSWEELSRPFGPMVVNDGTQHATSAGAVLEPALGMSVRSGSLAIGAQVAVAFQTNEEAMLTAVNAPTGMPIDLLFSLFVEARL